MGLFYIFLKKDLIIFWQGYIQNSGISRALAYLDLEAYWGSWYIQNPRHNQNAVKHIQWNVLQRIGTWRT